MNTYKAVHDQGNPYFPSLGYFLWIFFFGNILIKCQFFYFKLTLNKIEKPYFGFHNDLFQKVQNSGLEDSEGSLERNKFYFIENKY